MGSENFMSRTKSHTPRDEAWSGNINEDDISGVGNYATKLRSPTCQGFVAMDLYVIEQQEAAARTIQSIRNIPIKQKPVTPRRDLNERERAPQRVPNDRGKPVCGSLSQLLIELSHSPSVCTWCVCLSEKTPVSVTNLTRTSSSAPSSRRRFDSSGQHLSKQSSTKNHAQNSLIFFFPAFLRHPGPPHLEQQKKKKSNQKIPLRAGLELDHTSACVCVCLRSRVSRLCPTVPAPFQSEKHRWLLTIRSID